MQGTENFSEIKRDILEVSHKEEPWMEDAEDPYQGQQHLDLSPPGEICNSYGHFSMVLLKPSVWRRV